MNSRYKKIFGFLFIWVMLTNFSNAQYTYNLSKYEVGVLAGGLVSRTALSQYSPLGAYKQMHPSITFFAQGPLFKPFLIRASLMVGQIGSDDSKIDDPKFQFLKFRDFKYTTTMAELSTVIVWNLVREKYDLFSHEHSHRFTPYVFAGIGFSYVHVKRSWAGFDTAYYAGTPFPTYLGIDTTTTLPQIATVIPVGGGLRYAASPQIALFTEINFRYNFENYLDGFNYSTGRSNSKDFFYGVSIGVSYRPPANDYRNSCPKQVL